MKSFLFLSKEFILDVRREKEKNIYNFEEKNCVSGKHELSYNLVIIILYYSP